jgi:hypothetical protein
MTTTITIALIITVTVVLIGWDIYVATNKTKGDTETEVIRGWSRLFPALPYSLGVVLGHFSADHVRIVDSFAVGLGICVAVGVVLIAWSVIVGMGKGSKALVRAHEFVSRRRYVPALVGYLFGGLFWGP